MISATTPRRRGLRGEPARRSPVAPRRRPRRSAAGRLLGVVAAVLALAGAIVVVERDRVDRAIEELRLPLRHEDIIRQQAREKGLDPALIAAVIYEESRFRDQTSHAGAKGLMQILPGTAHFIARQSGGTRFELRDLATPQINIQYGSWYLRHLTQRYHGDEQLAVAAYNAGAGHVDRWLAEAGGGHSFAAIRHVAFPETRAYVRGVMLHRRMYRERYADELGIS